MKLPTTCVRACVLAFLVGSLGGPAHAQSSQVFKIGMVTDMSSAYSDLSGKLSVAAAQMAIDDFGGSVLGRKIELLTADHQLKATVGSTIATEWLDRDNVSAIVGLAGSSVALAVQAVLKDRPTKTVLFTIAGANEISGRTCIPNGIQWAPDAFSLGFSSIRYVSQKLGKSWFVMTADTAAGASAMATAVAGIQGGGAKLVGKASIPVNAGDVSSFVLQAQGLRADSVAISFGGSDLVNVVKAARQFGLPQAGVTLVASAGLYVSDIVSMGPDLAAGLVFVAPFYSEMNPEAKAWSARFQAKTGKMPAFSQVAEYEAVTHYLRAVKAADTDDARKVVPLMKSMPINSFALKDGKIRDDNHLVRPMYLGKVKSRAQSTSPSDYVELLAVVPPEQAYSSLAQSDCPMVKK